MRMVEPRLEPVDESRAASGDVMHAPEGELGARLESPAKEFSAETAGADGEALLSTRRRVAARADVHHPVGILPALQSLIYVLVISLFVMTFTLQPIRIPSSSMEPTLLVGDFLLMDKESGGAAAGWPMPPSTIRRGDVIVFHDPVEDPSVHLVKRVVGLPGDRIHLQDGVVYRDGVALNEAYAVHRAAGVDVFRDDFPNLNTMDAEVNSNWWIRLRGLVHDGEVTVPAGSYFVLGDNRNNSEDSRYWGFVPRSAIVGEPLLVYFSWRQPGSGETPGAEDTQRRWNIARWDRTFKIVR